MTKSRRKSIAAPAARGWRFAIVMLALMAFSLQSYVTQTHIHGVSAEFVKFGKHDPADKYPAKDDPANCPICQEILHAGQYVAPSAIAFALPSETIAIIPVRAAIRFVVEATSHDWRGRAPPQV